MSCLSGILGLVAAAGVVGGCATSFLPLSQAVPAGTAGFALDPVPTPRRSALADRVVVLPPGPIPVRFEDLPGGPPEAYVLEVGREGGETRIRIAASDAAGRRWASATLRQLLVTVGDRRFVRVGRIEDSPALPLRGSKRPLAWETLYRANLSYEKRLPDDIARRVGRTEVVVVLSPGGVLDATPAGIARAEAFFRSGHARGARRFAIEFDDVGFGMTPDTKDVYGTYPRALVHYLGECRERLRAIDPGAVLYWLPQTYWTDDERLPELARAIGLAGGLPRDLGLVVTGPEIISARIAAADVEKARRAFGLTETKALVYDNLGREGDHGPLAGRDPDLTSQVDGVFGERGEVLNRITRLDWNWNPRAYDPARSHLLACREIAGAAAARALSRLVLSGGRLAPGERARLVREVEEKLDPPPGREELGDRRALVRRILSGVAARP